MDWVTRLLGGTTAPKTAPRSTAHDPQLRLARFKRVHHTILQLCNRPRNLTDEEGLLQQLQTCLDKAVSIIREETRAPAPHLVLQFAAANQIYTVCARAASVSQYEPILQSTIAMFSSLVDSEEEDFLTNAAFAKSLMRLVRKALESGSMLVGAETETAILELLFTIAAKIRMQPEILSFWFQATARPVVEDIYAQEKKVSVGVAQKDDFPLCYLLIDRVHHAGRTGDFARTGLLYIFEATGRSASLERWIVSSDLPTLMASGLGALYSQLSRELSILHPDATLPAVLAMSDYSTMQPRATAESAFSDRHRSHMATFLSYLSFWQDVLDHCRSEDVKQTLLDHFQILFLQQLLYPSLLQSSDTDAGSSVAVLTYMNVMLESLEYPDLMQMMLVYLLAVDDNVVATSAEAPLSPARPPLSPHAQRRRQSLMLMTAPKDPDSAVEPSLFNLVDLIMNNITSKNDQAVFAALRLSSTLLNRQKRFALGTLLRVQTARRSKSQQTIGGHNAVTDRYRDLAIGLHPDTGLEAAYAGLVQDMRLVIEAEASALPTLNATGNDSDLIGRYTLVPEDPLIKALRGLLRSFFTNSIDVNLALTQVITTVALCTNVRLNPWLASDPAKFIFEQGTSAQRLHWQAHLDEDEAAILSALREGSRRPVWSDDIDPPVLQILQKLSGELETVRSAVSSFDELVSGRKAMLQANGLDAQLLPTDNIVQPGIQAEGQTLEIPQRTNGHRRASSQSSIARGRAKANDIGSPLSISLAASPVRQVADDNGVMLPLRAKSSHSMFQPPPPDSPSTTDILMQEITLPRLQEDGMSSAGDTSEQHRSRTASLNHILTNVVVLQEFVLELVAVLQVRAAVLGGREIRLI